MRVAADNEMTARLNADVSTVHSLATNDVKTVTRLVHSRSRALGLNGPRIGNRWARR